MLLEWLQSFPDALNQYCGFWCGFASVGMLPAVYCGLESSALPYSHTGQKPANETGLQGVTYRPCWCFRLFKKNSPKKKMEVLPQSWMSLKLHHSAPSERMKERKKVWGEGRGRKWERKRERISSLIQDDGSHPDTDWANDSTAHFRDYSVRQQHKTSCNVFIWFMLKPAEKNREQFRYFWLSLCTRMAFHSQSVNLLSKLACALGHGGGGGGGWGLPPGSHPHRQRDGSKCVCVGMQQWCYWIHSKQQ